MTQEAIDTIRKALDDAFGPKNGRPYTGYADALSALNLLAKQEWRPDADKLAEEIMFDIENECFESGTCGSGSLDVNHGKKLIVKRLAQLPPPPKE